MAIVRRCLLRHFGSCRRKTGSEKVYFVDELAPDPNCGKTSEHARECGCDDGCEAKYSFYFDEVTMIGRKAGRRGTYVMGCFRINYYYV